MDFAQHTLCWFQNRNVNPTSVDHATKSIHYPAEDNIILPELSHVVLSLYNCLAEDPSCPCGAAVQSGEQIVWHCNLHRYERARNRLTTMTREGEWGDLDAKIWAPNDDVEGRAESDEQQVDGVERFFDYYHTKINRSGHENRLLGLSVLIAISLPVLSLATWPTSFEAVPFRFDLTFM